MVHRFSRLRSLVVAGALALGTVAPVLVVVSPAEAAPPPEVTSLSARSGPVAGGATLTIRGKGFTQVRSVLFGTKPGTHVVVMSKRRLTVTVPPRARTGSVAVRVKTAHGTSAATSVSKYAYVPTATVSTSGSHSCLVTGSRAGYCWGYNVFGQVGSGSSDDVVGTPARIPGRWLRIIAQDGSTCGVRVDHTGWCWGLLGGSSPVQVPGSWKTLVPGGYLGCGIKGDDGLWCWGGNSDGQVGVGSTDPVVMVPTRVGGATWTWKSVVNASTHACAIRTNGRAHCWGDDSFGTIGNSDVNVDSNVPFALGTGWTQIATVDTHTCGVQSGVGRCWGTNDYGAVGNGAPGNPPFARVETPVSLAGGGIWSQLSVSSWTTCGVRTDGSAWCWGDGGIGGIGAGSSVLWSSTPVQVSSTGLWSSVDLGPSTTCGRRRDGGLYCWGSNGAGTLGNGTTTESYFPSQVPGRWLAADLTQYTVCAVQVDNSVWCWGRNHAGPTVLGAVGDGASADRLTPYQLPVTP